MNDSDIRKLVQEIIRQELAPILMASLVSNENSMRSIIVRSKTEGPIGGLRNIQPFGIASRAPIGTDSLIIPVNGDATHLNIVGYFDSSRPTVDNDGESVLYGADGQVIYMKKGGSIRQGIKTAASPVVLGDVLQTTIANSLSAFLNAASIGTSGAGDVVLDPGIRSILQSELDTHVNAAATNFLGQKNFVDRGA